MKITRKATELRVLGGDRLNDLVVEIELTPEEIREAFEQEQWDCDRCDALRHLSEIISNGETIECDGDIDGFIDALDVDHCYEFYEN